MPSPAPEPRDCHHCGLSVPAGTAFGFLSGPEWRSFCCPGCEAVSRAISGLGLEDYYRLRTAPADRPAVAPDPLESSAKAFDDPLLQQRFVRALDGGLQEADLLLEGMRCAACAWLVEQVVARQPGVVSIEVNYATRRSRLRWNPALARLGGLIEAVRAVGYAAWPYEEGRLALVERRERSALLRRLWVAGLGMMQVMMYAVPTYLAADGEMTADAVSLMRWAGLLLTTPVMAYSAWPFFRGAWRDLRMAHLGMDVPVALGLGVAFAASVVSTVAGSGEVYFDSVAMFVFLLLGGRWLEMVARSRAQDSLLHLARLVPQVATRLDDGGATESVPVARLHVGDRVMVKPGETVPADGELESAAAVVSEAWLSGESRSLPRSRGEVVLGGSINAASALVLRVTRVGADTALAAIQRLMERSLEERPRWVEAAQRASAFFVGFILLAAAASGAAWLAIDPSRAMWIAVAVLIVTCPCALALATPVVATVATGALARSNLAVTRGHAIEALAGATDVVFDKTGTLTHGEPTLVETIAFGREDREASLALAAAVARWSAHPLDRALASAAAQAPATEVERHESISGSGIAATVGGRHVRLGRASFVAELHGRPVPVSWVHVPDSITWLGDRDGWIAAFRLGDTLRPEAAAAIEALAAMGLRIHLLSGDEKPVAERVGKALGITRIAARATPEEKRRYVRGLQAAGARVAMVGDGINDAPVLAAADVSVAMGGGADLAQLRADAVLLGDSLADFVNGVRLARRARRIIRQNLGWALAYNMVAIPLAAAGWVTPLVAGIGMSASSLLVVANGLRARR